MTTEHKVRKQNKHYVSEEVKKNDNKSLFVRRIELLGDAKLEMKKKNATHHATYLLPSALSINMKKSQLRT